MGVCGEGGEAAAEGGLGSEGDECGFVGVARSGAAVAAAVRDAVRDGAYEAWWRVQYRAR